MGFSHCLAALDDWSSSYFSPGSLFLCTGSFLTGLLSRAAWLPHMTTCLLVHRFRNSLKLISYPSTCIPHTKHDQIPSLDKINYPYVLFLGSPLFIYSSIHQLPLVARCQPSSSTMGTLLAIHLSCQHITAYLY